MTFSALILAGGRSQRMGRDKAMLQVDGQPMLARQIALVRAVGATEVFISGRPGVDYTTFGCPVLEDAFAEAGPLAGIERGLASATQPRLLVLAVDLPAMTADFLRQMIQAGDETKGVVPSLAGHWEPLVAVYPRAAQTSAVARLAQRELRLQAWVEELREGGLVVGWPVPADAVGLFRNWNTPGA